MTNSNFEPINPIPVREQLTAEERKLGREEQTEQIAKEAEYKEQYALYKEQVKQEEIRNRPMTTMDIITEVPKAAYLGAKDTVASLITLPEQIIDLFSGEMQREFEETGTYDPEWDNWMTNDENPLETRTWWGGLMRGVTHYGTLIALTAATGGIAGIGKTGAIAKGGVKGLSLLNKANRALRVARVGAKKLKILPKLRLIPGSTSKVARLNHLTAHGLLKGSLQGAYFDAVSIHSFDDNLSGMLKEKIPFLDTPLATKEHDHPLMKKFRNITEGLFLGPIFDHVVGFMTDGLKFVKTQPRWGGRNSIRGDLKKPEGSYRELMGTARDDSVRDQNYEEALKHTNEKGFNAYKNEPIAGPHQGNSTSLDSLEGASQGMKDMETKWGTEEGIPGSVLSTSQVYNMAKSSKMTREEIMNVIRRGVSEDYFRQMDETAARQGIPKSQWYAVHAANAQRVMEGRMTSDMTPEEFWKSVTDVKVRTDFDNSEGLDLDALGMQELEFTHPAMAHTIDIINGTLLGEIKALGVLGREIQDIYSLRDVQGPAEQLVTKLIAGLRIRALAKAETSQLFRDLNARVSRGEMTQLGKRKYIDDMVEERVKQSIDAYRIALDIAPERGGDDLFKAYFEAISMAKGIHNLDDLDNWMRINLKGGRWKGDKKKMGVILREMGSMYTHSVLSGPKTSVRAIMGTGTATFTRPMALAMGGAVRGNWRQTRQGLASLNAMRETIPEAWDLFKTRLNAYWSGEIRGKDTRFYLNTKRDDQWKMYGHWAEVNGNWKDKMMFRLANMARWSNDNRFFTYSTKLMQATDDTFALLIGRARAREKAFLKASDRLGPGNFKNFDHKFFKQMEDEFQSQIWDANGNLSDEFALAAKKEATLTQDLEGFAKKLEGAFQSVPWARPFFLFAKTGVNGLALTAKHTPGFNLFVEEFRDIAGTSIHGDLSNLGKYGINNPQDLITAKAIQEGRLAMGATVLSLASWAYLSGGLYGNGPTDRKQRKAWQDFGWKPRTVRIGNTWVSYDAFEPFNGLLALVADIGDHMDLMGEEWAEMNFYKLSMAVAGTITSKSYLAGIQSFVDLFSGEEGQQNRILASLVNNQIPLSSLRNEIGKVLNPFVKELHSDIWTSIVNRNQFIGTLPVKYDILNGEPIKNHNFINRMFNAFSPVQFNIDYSEGRELLFDSGFDLKVVGYKSPDGIDLSDYPEIRSLYMQAIGNQNLEEKLNELASQNNIQISVAQMEYHRDNGMRWKDAKDYPHYQIIARLFDDAKKRAWAEIKDDPLIQQLIKEQKDRDALSNRTDENTIREILGINK